MTSRTVDQSTQAEDAETRLDTLSRTFQRIVDWQRNVVEITNDLLGWHTDGIDAAINAALARTGQLAGSDRTYVFRLREFNRLDNTHEWVADGIMPMIDHLQDLPDDVMSDWRDDLTANRQIYIPDIAALPDTSSVRNILLEQGIKSLLVVPMFRVGRLNGFVGYDAVREHRLFLSAEIELIQSVANAINAVMERARAELDAKAAHVRLQRESDRLRATLAAIPDLLLELDGEGRFVNEHSGGLLKPLLAREDFIGRLPEEVLPCELSALIRDIIAEVDRDGQSLGREYRLDDPDGPGWFQVSASAKSELREKGYIFLIRDITQSRHQQAQILRLSKIAELTSNLVIVTDPQDRIEWVNPAFEKRSGWMLKDLLGHRPKNFLQADMVDKEARNRIRATLRNGVAFKGELLNKSRSGEEYWTSVDITPLRDDTSSLTGFVAVQTDITDLKKSHARALNELAIAIEETTDGVILSDTDGLLKYLNRAARSLFGLAATEDTTALDWRDFFVDDKFLLAARHALNTPEGVWRGEATGQRGDGSKMMLEISLTRCEHGGVITIVRDITERSRQDIERTRLREELQVAQRKETIAHLATGIAHDLNNLIAVVDGTAVILETHIGDAAEILSGAERIRRAMKTARDLVSGLSRLDRSAARPAIHDLRILVAQGADLLGSQRQMENSVAVDAPDDFRPVWADSTDIQQVITNLAINACDARADRPNLVRMSVLPSSCALPARAPDVGSHRPDTAYSAFVISDTGTGIDPAHRKQIFERYFTTKGKKGTGLGMPIVASIVRENNGAIWLDSVPGEGSTVTVAWPSTAPNRVARIKPAPRRSSAPTMLSRLRILVVDDVPDVANVVASMIRTAGPSVVVARDPASALDMIADRTEAWSVLVTDLNMPGHSGIDLARAAASRNPPLPVVLVTALPDETGANRELFAGVVSKPINVPDLIDAIRTSAAS